MAITNNYLKNLPRDVDTSWSGDNFLYQKRQDESNSYEDILRYFLYKNRDRDEILVIYGAAKVGKTSLIKYYAEEIDVSCDKIKVISEAEKNEKSPENAENETKKSTEDYIEDWNYEIFILHINYDKLKSDSNGSRISKKIYLEDQIEKIRQRNKNKQPLFIVEITASFYKKEDLELPKLDVNRSSNIDTGEDRRYSYRLHPYRVKVEGLCNPSAKCLFYGAKGKNPFRIEEKNDSNKKIYQAFRAFRKREKFIRFVRNWCGRHPYLLNRVAYEIVEYLNNGFLDAEKGLLDKMQLIFRPYPYLEKRINEHIERVFMQMKRDPIVNYMRNKLKPQYRNLDEVFYQTTGNDFVKLLQMNEDKKVFPTEENVNIVKEVIFRVYDKSDSHVGMAFYYKNGCVITCAHVAEDALDLETSQSMSDILNKEIILKQGFDSQREQKTTVVYIPKALHDITVEELKDSPEDYFNIDICVLELEEKSQLEEPKLANNVFGQLGILRYVPDIPRKYISIDTHLPKFEGESDTLCSARQLQSDEIFKGTSGSAVWTKEQNEKVIAGMVISRYKENDEQAEQQCGWMMSSLCIDHVWKKFQSSE